MKLTRILPFARELLTKAVPKSGIAIDATAGNGHDTLFLAKCVGEHGFVYSFDIQKQAIETTKSRLMSENALTPVNLIHDGHENLLTYLKTEHNGQVDGAIFNLGYLPGSDKSIVTIAETTITAIRHILTHLKSEGLLILVIYSGHMEGQKEREVLIPFVRQLPQDMYHVLEYRFTNQRNNPPFIIAIEKR
ncbi:class I SAM-dependent methyltransferase [Salipaludibacillus agaradhaerens]|uniref:class I SAM-dependent methyltransferase n=1 Tax=Salipaludibacillus agaradhaerens TaxID=76935 RepID=UPI0021516BB7|nr:class I SAM-dependent methyltransferase [Salipaludibacillus agaradhaerens]MCR6107667.1 class I SAM-dependent methyltransferase [Salipaludibacillus agaradhaerens]MCR6119696.1 class I SAM-dependent methyltransferase [Salipaludibacillus agaradhaerens]